MGNPATELVARLRDADMGDDHGTQRLLMDAADEITCLRRDLEIQTVNATAVLQAQHERDCAVEKLAELRKLLTDCADLVSCQLAEARRNLELYKGYSSRERRYQVEIEGLERLLKEIGNG